MQQISYLLPI